ncbi:tyrosine-type recombinase/integrase [Fuerstiella marisgermanici]|uniref:Site-specific tyrosine recombinase n=1 Tax=Fuerstiella marisgermanici TaxID=1891926 RepID=A0A1P8WKG9_9PLAN|nr:site-specific integrase [Fuerstiella marisgermanici]APZ94554.1 site-specific tyrosine recombinase [Fuerstiella marisgermanici]
MARNRKRQANGCAWHRRFDDGWYATIDGQRTRLRDEMGQPIRGKDNRQQADLAVARLKLQMPEPAAHGAVLVATVAEAYLDHLKATASAAYVDLASRAMNDFCGYCGGLAATDLKKKHVRDWVAQHPSWKSDNTKRDNMTMVMAAFNHAVKEEEILDTNPISGLKKPAAFARVTFFKEDEVQEVLDYCNRKPKKKAVSLAPTGQYFSILLQTGARPFSELARVTADDVHETDKGMVIRFKAGTDAAGNYRHKAAKKTGKDRTIYLFAEAEDVIRSLMEEYPRGSGVPLFRTPRGKSWKRCNGVQSFCTIKRKLGWDKNPDKKNLSLYTCRHTFAKRILSGYWTGQPATIETLAGLMGNTPKVCWDHYAQWCDEYNEPLWAAVGRGRRLEAQLTQTPS